MIFLFDQNISYRILRLLPDQMKDSSHVKSENLLNAPDLQIWEFAKQKRFTIVTMDSDFSNLSTLFGFPPKVIWIRTGNMQTKEILDILIQYIGEIKYFIENVDFGCYEIYRIALK